MHWGSEYTHTPTYEETSIANYLASLDVDLIIEITSRNSTNYLY